MVMPTKITKNRTRMITAITIVTTILLITVTACKADNKGATISQPYIQQVDTESEAPLVKIPDLRGYPLEALTFEFSNLGLTPSLVMLLSDEPVDTVLSIKRVGQLVPTYATVEVLVSGGLPDWGEPEAPNASESSTQRQEFEKMRFGGIDWLVLEKEENKVLLLSEFVLFDRAYNDELVYVTWETSTLRSYLNNEFFNSFSLEERERIAETRVVNDEIMASYGAISMYGVSTWPVSAGNDTDDRVFLLSVDEERRYFAAPSDRVVRRQADDVFAPGEEWIWWLRSPAHDNFHAITIPPNGADNMGGRVTRSSYGVRPALWLYLD
jgi:hypothetical protein